MEIPAAPQPLTAHEQESLDEAVEELQSGAAKWAAASAAERAALLSEVVTALGGQSSRWVRTASDIKGVPPASHLVG